MTENKLELYQADPERYQINSIGAVFDKTTGRFCDMISELNPHAITPANAHAMQERRRQITLTAQLRGLARAFDLTLDDATLEQIAASAGSAVELLTEHMARTFMASSNIRGQAEAYRALLSPLVGDNERREIVHVHELEINDSLQQLIDFMKDGSVEGKVIP